MSANARIQRLPTDSACCTQRSSSASARSGSVLSNDTPRAKSACASAVGLPLSMAAAADNAASSVPPAGLPTDVSATDRM